MNNSYPIFCTTRIVAQVHALLCSSLRVIAMALAFATALIGGNIAQAQCPPAWVPVIGTTGTNNQVNSLAVLPDGDVLVGGFFGTAGGVSANNIARYNPSTGVWSALGSGIGGRVDALAVLPGGTVLVGGTFSTAGGVSARNIARYNPSTGVWSALGTGTDNNVMSLVVLPGGDVIVGGNFTIARGVPANRIARYNPNTGTWSALGAGIDISSVTDLAGLLGGDVIAGGTFTAAGGVPATNIARYNPTTGVWSALGAGTNDPDRGPGTDSRVNALAVLPGGDVIVGGDFSTAGGVPANRIARYNPSTGVWSALGSGTSSGVYSLVVLPGGDVLAGGFFTTAGGVPANRIARYNPSTGEWSTLGTGIGGPEFSQQTVYSLVVLPGGDVIAGGRFSTAGGEPTSNIARYSFGTPAPTITTQPTPQTACTASTATFAVTPAGTGPFTYQWRKGGVPINTTTNPSAATGTLTLSGVQDGDAGSYDCVVTTPCGSATSDAAVLTIAPCACGLSDVAGPGQSIGSDGTLTADDIIVFLNWFFAGDTRADVAGPGQSTTPDSQFTADDIIVFLNRFFAGC